MIVRPPEPKTETVYRIAIAENTVRLYSPTKDDKLIKLLYSFGFEWNRIYWARRIGKLAGCANDRAVELACHLLAAGFIVELPDEIYPKVVSQDYEPEHLKWILTGAGEYTGWFRLYWKRSKEDFWNTTRNFLSGNRYDHETKCICVPSEYFAQIEDFAQIHGFKFSDKATELLAEAKQRQAEMVTVDIKLKEKKPTNVAIVDDGDVISQFLDTPYRDFTIEATTDMYAHQSAAVEKTLPVSVGALFMEMGTGKTRTAIELVCKRQDRISNVVWLCPVSLKETIAYEIRKHTNTPASQVVKFDDGTTIDSLSPALWYIVGIESMSSSNRVVLTVANLIDEHSFVIVDESSYIKGHDSKRTRRITDLSAKAKYRLILTGTPLSQGVVDLYAQMRFLSPGILGYRSFYSFARNHLEYSEEYPGLIVRSHNTDKLAAKIQPFTYQVTKEECLDLPDKVFNAVYFGMTREQREAYEQVKQEILSLAESSDRIDSYVIFRLFTMLQQVASGFLNGSETVQEFSHRRLITLLSTIEAIPPDEKVIIWCKYRYSVKAIAERLEDVALFYGDLNERERMAEIEKFRNGTRFFVSTQATGGHGLTLNEARYVIFYENEFKYANRLQAEDRNHRIGQESKVTYIDISCLNSIDDRILRSLAKKGNLVQDFKRQIDRVKDKRRLLRRL